MTDKIAGGKPLFTVGGGKTVPVTKIPGTFVFLDKDERVIQCITSDDIHYNLQRHLEFVFEYRRLDRIPHSIRYWEIETQHDRDFVDRVIERSLMPRDGDTREGISSDTIKRLRALGVKLYPSQQQQEELVS